MDYAKPELASGWNGKSIEVNHDYFRELTKKRGRTLGMIITKTLNEAIKYSRQGKGTRRIYAEEVGSRGEREFLVMSQEVFIDFYQFLKPGQHFYEVLGSDWWKKGFWDIDYWDRTREGEESREERKERTVLAIIMELIKGFYDRGFTLCRDDFVILDSSSKTKISFHLILQNGPWFEENQDIECITRKCFYRNDEPEKEFAVKTHGKITSIVDTTVYGMNQNFRIWQSSKFGSDNTLEISSLDRFTLGLKDGSQKLTSTLINGDRKEGERANLASERKITKNPPLDQSDFHVNGSIREAVSRNCDTGIANCRRLSNHTILINTMQNMFCEVAKRVHSSNRTYLLMNTETGHIFKKCHKCVDQILCSFKV